MEEQDYGHGVKRISMSGTEALSFLDGLKGQAEARDLVNEGARLFQAGDLAGAEAKYKEAVAANPDNAVAHGNIGHVCFERHQYQEAIPWLEKALTLDPNLPGVADCLRECRSQIHLPPAGAAPPSQANQAAAKASIWSYEGRIPRSTFWAIWLSLLGINLVLTVFVSAVGSEDLAAVVNLIYLVPAVWLGVAAQVKRWHDMNFSGWMVLLNFTIVALPVVLIILGCRRGTRGQNSFGNDPLPGSGNTPAAEPTS